MSKKKKLWKYLHNSEWENFYEGIQCLLSSAHAHILKQLTKMGAADCLFELMIRGPTLTVKIRVLIVVIHERPDLNLMRTVLKGITPLEVIESHNYASTLRYMADVLMEEVQRLNDAPVFCEVWNRVLKFLVLNRRQRRDALMGILNRNQLHPPSQILQLFIQHNLAWELIPKLLGFLQDKKKRIKMDFWIPFCEQIRFGHLTHRLKKELRKIHEEIRIYHLKIREWMAPIPVHLVDDILSYFHLPK